ncbi:hypothetical protein ACOJBM_19580 [Rhizobium beringeri]
MAEGIEFQKVRRLVGARRHVDLDQFIRHAKQRQEQVSPVCMTGERVMVEFHDGSFGLSIDGTRLAMAASNHLRHNLLPST